MANVTGLESIVCYKGWTPLRNDLQILTVRTLHKSERSILSEAWQAYTQNPSYVVKPLMLSYNAN